MRRPCPVCGHFNHPAMTDGMQEDYYWCWICKIEYDHGLAEAFI